MPAPPDVSNEGCVSAPVEAAPSFNAVELLQDGQAINTNSARDGANWVRARLKTQIPAFWSSTTVSTPVTRRTILARQEEVTDSIGRT